MGGANEAIAFVFNPLHLHKIIVCLPTSRSQILMSCSRSSGKLKSKAPRNNVITSLAEKRRDDLRYWIMRRKLLGQKFPVWIGFLAEMCVAHQALNQHI